MVLAMRSVGVPVDISDTAATFGCNLLMYGVLHHVVVNALPISAGWVHLRSLPQTAALERNRGAPSLRLETQVEGLHAGIAAAVEHKVDVDTVVRSNFHSWRSCRSDQSPKLAPGEVAPRFRIMVDSMLILTVVASWIVRRTSGEPRGDIRSGRSLPTFGKRHH
jgi:hypothetical protein